MWHMCRCDQTKGQLLIILIKNLLIACRVSWRFATNFPFKQTKGNLPTFVVLQMLMTFPGGMATLFIEQVLGNLLLQSQPTTKSMVSRSLLMLLLL